MYACRNGLVPSAGINLIRYTDFARGNLSPRGTPTSSNIMRANLSFCKFAVFPAQYQGISCFCVKKPYQFVTNGGDFSGGFSFIVYAGDSQTADRSGKIPTSGNCTPCRAPALRPGNSVSDIRRKAPVCTGSDRALHTHHEKENHFRKTRI